MRPLCLLTEKEKSGMIKMVTFSCWCQKLDCHGHCFILGASQQITMVTLPFLVLVARSPWFHLYLMLVVRSPWSQLFLWSQLLDCHGQTSVFGASCQIAMITLLCWVLVARSLYAHTSVFGLFSRLRLSQFFLGALLLYH